MNNVVYKAGTDAEITRWRFIVPAHGVPAVLRSAHTCLTSGYLGVKKTRDRNHARFWWLDWRSAVETFIRECHSCQLNKNTQLPRVGSLQPIRSLLPGDIIASDIKGPMPVSSSGNRYVLIVIDSTILVMIMPNYFTAGTRGRILLV